MKFSTVALPIIGLQVLPSVAQTVPREHIWSTVIYTRYGDRTPYILQTTNTLTPLGATQMYSAGNRFRDRYLTSTADSGNTVIQNISPFQLNSDQVSIVSLRDQFVVASAQAFLQGLYPPLQASSNDTFINGQSQLANGSNVVSPLDGYQYPQIDTVSALDLNSIWLMGATNCPVYSASKREYFDSVAYEGLLESNKDFYLRLQPALLDGIFANNSVNYLNAYLIFDYLNYGSIHNSSFHDDLSFDDFTKAKILADNWIWATSGNTSASGLTDGDQIRAIAGRTLANRIVQALYSNINTSGAYDKITLLFGGLEPIVSFAALSGLASEQNPQFYGIPEYGSSMVFELFSLNENDTAIYPSPADLNVRFSFQNGTGETSELVAYPLFGNGPSGTSMPLSNFVTAMQEFMILSPAGWCRTCASYSIFCPAFQGDGDNAGNGSGRSEPQKGLKPVVAGVVGAAVTVAVIGLILAALALFGGVRLYRQRRNKRSELNGFKGGEKLASDQDLSIPKGGAGASVAAAAGAAPARGHERVGSWELGDQKKAKEAQLPGFQSHRSPARRPSFEQDDLHVNPFGEAVKPHDRV
jgi:Histidine phosphatase superfamily (branch 2)